MVMGGTCRVLSTSFNMVLGTKGVVELSGHEADFK